MDEQPTTDVRNKLLYLCHSIAVAEAYRYSCMEYKETIQQIRGLLSVIYYDRLLHRTHLPTCQEKPVVAVIIFYISDDAWSSSTEDCVLVSGFFLQ